MTIEQMAEHYANRVTCYSKHERWYEAKKDYIEAATEQQEIVIKRACEWIAKNMEDCIFYDMSMDEILTEFKIAIKGE